MTNKQIRELFLEHGYYFSFDDYDDDDESWSNIIHSQPESEYLNKYEDDPDFFDFMWYMRAECIKNAVYYVSTTIKNGKEEYYHFEDCEDYPILLFSTMKDAEYLYEQGTLPSLECCKKIFLRDLINEFNEDVMFIVNPMTNFFFVHRSFYLNYFVLSENITEKRIKEIIDKRKTKRGSYDSE